MKLEDIQKSACLSVQKLLQVYRKHKEYCGVLKTVDGERMPNLPECISESLVCMHEPGTYRIKSCKSNKKGDIYSRFMKILIEVKATKGMGPSSFGTESLAELFYYIYMDIDTNRYEIYVFDRSEVKKINVSKDCCIGKVWSDNKKRSKKVRPRVDLWDQAKKAGKKPKYVGTMDKTFLKGLRTKVRQAALGRVA